MNSKTGHLKNAVVGVRRLDFGGRIYPVKSGKYAKGWHEPKILQTRRSKTDQISGTEKVLAQYPTISRLKMGELSGIQGPTNKKSQAGVGVVKESFSGASESVGMRDRMSERRMFYWRRSCQKWGRKIKRSGKIIKLECIMKLEQ